MDFVAKLLGGWGLTDHPTWSLLGGIVLLLIAGEGVVWILNHLEKHQFGNVHLGALFTPLCTGFPNLMLGIFGGKRLSGDLVLHLNIGNNIANSTLVVGMLIFICGPLSVSNGKGKQAKAETTNFSLALTFLWFGAFATFFLASDGLISRFDGFLLFLVYLSFQSLLFLRRGKPTKKKQLPTQLAFLLLGGLLAAAVSIVFAIEAIAIGMSSFQSKIPGAHLGMFLGLLTVLPESFLLLRLARRSGSLGLSGLVGDCLVSIPLVIGVATMISPVKTAAVSALNQVSAIPYLSLALGMSCLSLLALRNQPIQRLYGLALIFVYLFIWWLTPSS